MIQRPTKLNPWSKQAQVKDKSGTVWISMKPRKILDQFSKGVGSIATEELPETFVFQAPLSLNENIVHHWEAYESVASRIAQKVRSAVKLGAEGAALLQTGSNMINSEQIKQLFSSKASDAGVAIENFVKAAYGNVVGSVIPKIKVDTPLYYTNSDRRQLVVEFQLFHENISSNPENVLVKPIQKMMKYSSPHLPSRGGISIDFPYMWEVQTIPYQFINYTTCALIGVQPTWNAPYLQGGVPSSVNLQLTFQDMSPLYRDTITEGSVIRVINPNEAESRRAQGAVPTTIQGITNALDRAKQLAGGQRPEVARIPSTPGSKSNNF
jgi:hypothetical protein